MLNNIILWCIKKIDQKLMIVILDNRKNIYKDFELDKKILKISRLCSQRYGYNEEKNDWYRKLDSVIFDIFGTKQEVKRDMYAELFEGL